MTEEERDLWADLMFVREVYHLRHRLNGDVWPMLVHSCRDLRRRMEQLPSDASPLLRQIVEQVVTVVQDKMDRINGVKNDSAREAADPQ